MKRLLLIFFISFFLVSYSYAITVEDIERSLVKDNISGSFIQTKKLANFPNPIKSSGRFEIKEKILLWNTLKPIKNSLKLSSEGIFTLSKDNKWVLVPSQFDKSLILDILEMNIENIKKTFKISANGSSSSWVIGLEPKSLIIKKVFNNISIEGDKYVSKVTMNESSGDVTVMEFIVK